MEPQNPLPEENVTPPVPSAATENTPSKRITIKYFAFAIIGFACIGILFVLVYFFTGSSEKIVDEDATSTQDVSNQTVDSSVETVPTEVPSFGITFSVPEDWQKTIDNEDMVEWSIPSGGLRVGSVRIRKNKVLSFQDDPNPKQEVTETISGIEGQRVVEVIGATVSSSFAFEKEDESGEIENYVMELEVPNQANIDQDVSSQIHEEFDELVESLEFINDIIAAEDLDAEMALSKSTVIADGVDFAILDINLKDEDGVPLKKIYVTILPIGDDDNKIVVKSPMPESKTDTAAHLMGENVLVAGGRNYNDRLTSAASYNLERDTWTVLPSLARKRSNLTIEQYNGQAFAIGGYKDISELQDNPEEYDSGLVEEVEVISPQNNVWSDAFNTDELSTRAIHASAVIDNKLYVLAGLGKSVYDECHSNEGSVVSVYDFSTSEWSVDNGEVICITAPEYALMGREIYLFGGNNPNYFLGELTEEERQDQSKLDEALYSKNLYIYNVDTKQWRRGQNLPHGRARGQAVTIGSYIYLIGGFKPTERDIYDWRNEHVDVYHPATDTWRTMGNLFPTPIDFSAVSANGKIYTFGGDHMYFWPASNAVLEISLVDTIRESVVNPSSEGGLAQFAFRSLIPGKKTYSVRINTSNGQKDLGKIEVTFE